MKKVLILGVNGFIGHHLSNRILETTDWEVYGMDMSSERISDLIGKPRFHFFEGDITINKEWVEYHIKKCGTGSGLRRSNCAIPCTTRTLTWPGWPSKCATAFTSISCWAS